MILSELKIGQTEYFFLSILLGVLLGVLYDVFRLVRLVLPKKSVIIFFEDILFCMSATVCFLLLVFNAGSGQIRGFAVFGTLFGFATYYKTLGKLVFKANELILGFLKKILKWLVKTLTSPFVVAAKKITTSVKGKTKELRRKKAKRNALRSIRKS